MTSLIEELAAQLDVETATNVTTNFLRYQQKYVDYRLTALRAGDPTLSKKGVSELLCYVIDMLPLEGRKDLVDLKAEVDIESVVLKRFIESERLNLARMMGVDDIFQHDDIKKVDDSRVDMRLALGFGDHKCIQADFLFPAVLEMSKSANIPVTLIPSSGPRRRPILFNSRATERMMCNLEYFARRYGLSQTKAQEITTKYKASLKEVDNNDKEHDLGSIAFLLDVGIKIIDGHVEFCKFIKNMIFFYHHSSGQKPLSIRMGPS